MSAMPARPALECVTCRYWRQHPKAWGGICWRYPPTPVLRAALDGSGKSYSDYLRPYTEPPDFCGEHQPIPTPGAPDHG